MELVKLIPSTFNTIENQEKAYHKSYRERRIYMAKGCDTAAYLTDSRVDALVGKGSRAYL